MLSRGVVVLSFLLLNLAFLSIRHPNTDSETHGQVVDNAGPVAGATVRRQGLGAFTLTDADGRFSLRGTHRRRPITASKAGFLIATGASQNTRLHLHPIPDDADDDYAWIDPSPDPSKPRQCANCHAQIHDEWSTSAHANSSKNRKFLHLFAGSDGSAPPAETWNLSKEHPLGSGVCATCHAPTLSSPDLDYDVRQARGVHAHGVHCDYCHKIAEAPTDKLGTRFGRDGYRLVRPKNGEQLFFGPLDDAVRRGESFAHAPFYKDSSYCASCHEGIVFGVHVYGTYSEWLESPAKRQGRQCQDCHMTPTGTMTNIAPGHGGIERDPKTLASHRFPGGTREMLRQCLSVQTTWSRGEKDVEVNVITLAQNVGHRVPTGFIDRHLLLVVEAFGADGQALPANTGPLLPARAGSNLAGRPGWIFGKQHLDAAKLPLPFWRTADDLIDTRLSPEQPDLRRFIFPKEAATVRVRLIYRRFWNEVAAKRGWTDNEEIVVDQLHKVW